MDDDLLPPEDKCVVHLCGRPESAHTGWSAGGPAHSFQAPLGKPRPERIAGCDIVTSWHCTHCGEYCEVEGLACDEWMDCTSCGRYSYVVPSFESAAPAAMSVLADSVTNHG